MQDLASRGLAAGALIADATKSDVPTGAALGGLAGAASCGIEFGLPPCNLGY